MSNIEEVHPLDKCSICGEPIRYWHDHLVDNDDIVQTKYHERCAKNYKEWAYKITHILPSYHEPQLPINYRWERYFQHYQRRLLGTGTKK